MTDAVERPEPVYFGSRERPLFGWLHRPRGGAALRAEGMVVCNPFGSEALSAHRSLRRFAECAAAQGVPSIRFDYDGTGDSAGTDRDPGRLAAWLRSVHEAVDELRRGTGVERVYLLGVRFGAALAALAAVDRTDVAGLVAIVPVVSGKQWLREVDALQIAMRAGDPPPGTQVEAGIHESAGFILSAETRASVAGIDLLALPQTAALQVLLISRADLAQNERLASRLTALGSNVDHRRLPGFAEMTLDPHDAIVPAEMIEAVHGWLAARATPAAAGAPANPPASPAGKAALVAPGVEEEAVFVDDARTMFGIVSGPTSGDAPRRAVLLLNSGANHHIGPGRLYVDFARRWAARGFRVLRVDLSGIGDSAARPGEPENAVYSRPAIGDVRDSVTYLRERWGAESVSAIGLCSGAYHALKAAVAGVPLTGVIVINPLVFFWREGMSLNLPPYQVSRAAIQYRKSAFQLEKWKKLFAGKVDLGEFMEVLTHRTASVVEGWVRDIARQMGRPFTRDLGAELEALAQRDVSVAFLFAAGDPGEDMLKVQAGSSLRRLARDRRVRVYRIFGANHTFTPIWSHALVTETLDGELGIR